MIKRSSSRRAEPPGSTVQRSRVACVLCFTDERPARCGTGGQDWARFSTSRHAARSAALANPSPTHNRSIPWLSSICMHLMMKRSDLMELWESFCSRMTSQQTKGNESLVLASRYLHIIWWLLYSYFAGILSLSNNRHLCLGLPLSYKPSMLSILSPNDPLPIKFIFLFLLFILPNTTLVWLQSYIPSSLKHCTQKDFLPYPYIAENGFPYPYFTISF